MNEALFSSGKDDWETPPDLFKKLNDEFHFTLDVCANEKNHKLEHYFSEKDDGLKQSWKGEVCWCNPPYSRETKTNPGQASWIRKAYQECVDNGVTTVMLLPARTDTIVFHEYIYGKAEIRFIKGRLKFVGASAGAPFPSMIVIFRR